ncbi:MAG: hypothetical protein U0931_12740 [Vulcanimicrobiota bacterium]
MRPKALLILSLLLMLTPSFLYWGGVLRRPAMADGDQLTLMACPQCGGSGQSESKLCPRCRGKKQVQFIIPGPHRPTYVEGHVYAPDGVTVVPAAALSFQSEAGGWQRKTDEQGRFGADLGPGKYPLEIVAPQGKLTTVIEVLPQVTPSPADLDPTFPKRVDRFVLQK